MTGPSRYQAGPPRNRRAGSRSSPTWAGWLIGVGAVGVLVIVALGAAFGGRPSGQATATRDQGSGPSAVAVPSVGTPSATTGSSPAPSVSDQSPPPVAGPVVGVTNVYAGAGAGMFSPAVAGLPPRVYVPDELTGTVVVIDPTTFKILYRYKVGASPEHVTPDWDLRRLYVEAAFADHLTVISPKTGRPTGHHTVPGPYNLYFTPDGTKAIVVLDSRLSGSSYGAHQLYFYDRRTWRLIKALRIPWAGADHLDFSADGSYFLISTEYSGWVAKVDVKRMAVTDAPLSSAACRSMFVWLPMGASSTWPIRVRMESRSSTRPGCGKSASSRPDEGLTVSRSAATRGGSTSRIGSRDRSQSSTSPRDGSSTPGRSAARRT